MQPEEACHASRWRIQLAPSMYPCWRRTPNSTIAIRYCVEWLGGEGVVKCGAEAWGAAIGGPQATGRQ